MAQTLPEGAIIAPADIERIAAAYRDLDASGNAHGSLLVRVSLHIHREYPKHVQVGGKTVVVNSEAEHAALTAAPKPVEPVELVELPPATDDAATGPQPGIAGDSAAVETQPAAEAFDDSPADTPEEVAEEAADEVDDAVAEANAIHEAKPHRRKRAS